MRGVSARCRSVLWLVLSAAVLLAAPPSKAEQKPLWELGLGVGVVSFPDYRGADQRQRYLLPTPYFVYRGEFLRSDRKGLRGVFFDSDRVELNLSLSGSVPVDSDGNDARRGMPDLRPTVEFGPSLDFGLWHSADRRRSIDLRLPLRWALRIGGAPRDVGMVFSPRLNLDIADPAGFDRWQLGLLAGPIFTDRRNNAYYYDVAERFATADRPAYGSRGGYAGSQYLVALSKRYPRFWVGFFARYDSLRGATFDDSPLLRSDDYWAAGLAISWILGESAIRVDYEE
ncbi:MAG: MipA/OmpV family protein [Rhodocyclaceae bacterium]|nr:MipA/OmpV family protein [Rhodocyclaceae bacterium]